MHMLTHIWHFCEQQLTYSTGNVDSAGLVSLGSSDSRSLSAQNMQLEMVFLPSVKMFELYL